MLQSTVFVGMGWVKLWWGGGCVDVVMGGSMCADVGYSSSESASGWIHRMRVVCRATVAVQVVACPCAELQTLSLSHLDPQCELDESAHRDNSSMHSVSASPRMRIESASLTASSLHYGYHELRILCALTDAGASRWHWVPFVHLRGNQGKKYFHGAHGDLRNQNASDLNTVTQTQQPKRSDLYTVIMKQVHTNFW